MDDEIVVGDVVRWRDYGLNSRSWMIEPGPFVVIGVYDRGYEQRYWCDRRIWVETRTLEGGRVPVKNGLKRYPYNSNFVKDKFLSACNHAKRNNERV